MDTRLMAKYPPYHRKAGEWDTWVATPWALAGRVAVWPFGG